MPRSHNSLLALAGKLALVALALGACAAPAAVPTQPATALPPTVVPATTAATAQSTQAVAANIPVPPNSISLGIPTDIVFDANGNLYVSDCSGPVVKINLFGLLTVYAGTGAAGFHGDGGPARSAEFDCAAGLAFDRAGNLYVADLNNNRIRRIDRNGIISTVAGSGPGGFGGDGGPATSALLWNPTDIVFDTVGNLYIDDTHNNRIRRMDQQGIITTIAGDGTVGFSGDGGPATAAQMTQYFHGINGGSGMTFDSGGNLYVADSANGRVRKIDRQGIITTIAGTGGSVVSGDGGPAMAAVLVLPTGLAFDAEGDLYIADSGNYRVRKVDKQGLITTVAGTGEPGYAGDGGLATAAGLSRPTGLAFDAQGNLYISDGPGPLSGENRVRKIDTHGIITTVVGTGALGFSGDGGPATSATLNGPWGFAFDPQGNLYIADEDNNRVRKVDKNGIITTVVGGRP